MRVISFVFFCLYLSPSLLKPAPFNATGRGAVTVRPLRPAYRPGYGAGDGGQTSDGALTSWALTAAPDDEPEGHHSRLPMTAKLMGIPGCPFPAWTEEVATSVVGQLVTRLPGQDGSVQRRPWSSDARRGRP